MSLYAWLPESGWVRFWATVAREASWHTLLLFSCLKLHQSELSIQIM